ncbi:zinc finger CCCH domain-containing protein [Musa troglodytarum]|uniref:Zinc finger CCCH domain-containing protein n=1 Tax=Musa troglodytarum TaxID=320322 RepID=A0A9E7KHC0_9LILI|nr:zinc finger CCCH domain-containing protein [Musa troglodytarum]
MAMEKPDALPNADEEGGDGKELGLGFRTLPHPPLPSSHGTDAIDGDLEKLGPDEKIADKLQFCALEEKKCTGGVGAFETEENRGEKSEEEGGAGGEKEGLRGKADVVEVWVTSKKADAASKADERENRSMGISYPQRPGQLDCAYYLRTGICGYGANCKFNHPPRIRLTQLENLKARTREPELVQYPKNKPCDWNSEQQPISKEEKEEFPEKAGQTECKFFLMPGGCKFGNSCMFAHSQQNPEVLGIRLNFLGLPIRTGEKECPYYMRTGSCKFSSNCWFNHPDPTVVTAQDCVLEYRNGGSPKQHASAEMNMPNHFHNFSQTVTHLDSLPSYIPSSVPPPKGLNFNPNLRSQVPSNPSFPSTRNIQQPQPSCAISISNSSAIQQQGDMVYPERPGQPECPYFMKTGDCKFRSACKFHHPRSRFAGISSCNISPLGLPLRPEDLEKFQTCEDAGREALPNTFRCFCTVHKTLPPISCK